MKRAGGRLTETDRRRLETNNSQRGRGRWAVLEKKRHEQRVERDPGPERGEGER